MIHNPQQRQIMNLYRKFTFLSQFFQISPGLTHPVINEPEFLNITFGKKS